MSTPITSLDTLDATADRYYQQAVNEAELIEIDHSCEHCGEIHKADKNEVSGEILHTLCPSCECLLDDRRY